MANPFKILPIVVLAQVALGVILGASSAQFENLQGFQGKETQHKASNLIKVSFPDSNTSLRVKVADTPEERRKGLMYREKLPIDRGMLFIFPKEAERGFWMKNTLIPLDMMFIDSKGKILNIEEAYPEPKTSEEDLKIYRSDGKAKYVIEANSTFVEKKDVEKGDRVEIPTRY